MRKLLMASAAILGASGGLALAQTAAPSQGQLAAPYGAGPAQNNNNNAWGIANTPTGSAAAGALSTIYAPNVDAVPAPGTVVIRLNGRVEVDMAATFTSVDKSINAEGVATNSYKLNPLGIATYFRLYPGFDGLAANGLRYGASVELRENFVAGNASSIEQPAGTGTAAGPSANSSSQTMFVRRAFTYLATDQAGIVRFGQGDGVLGLFDPCIFQSGCFDAGIGNVNGGLEQTYGPSNVAIPFVWLSQAGYEYGNSKIVYLSPQYFGFDFAVQYAPSEGNAFQAEGSGAGCGQAAPGCINLTSGNDPTRWFNQVGVGLRYQQTFGAVDFKAYGFYETAGKENLTTSPYATPTQARLGTLVGGVAGGAQTERYDNLSFYKGGVAVTAFNFTAAADYIGGAVNQALNERPTGGATMNAVLAGLTYANGPIALGAQFGVIDDQGDARLVGVSQRHQYEATFGGNYKLAPGVQLVGEYMYEYLHQGGFDFSTGTLGAGGTAAHAGLTRDGKAQTFVFATVLVW
ncbi:MAG: hypothetical protein ABSC06_32830 [Rhodopila sp.]